MAAAFSGGGSRKPESNESIGGFSKSQQLKIISNLALQPAVAAAKWRLMAISCGENGSGGEEMATRNNEEMKEASAKSLYQWPSMAWRCVYNNGENSEEAVKIEANRSGGSLKKKRRRQ
jgi:hypothetical protein